MNGPSTQDPKEKDVVLRPWEESATRGPPADSELTMSLGTYSADEGDGYEFLKELNGDGASMLTSPK